MMVFGIKLLDITAEGQNILIKVVTNLANYIIIWYRISFNVVLLHIVGTMSLITHNIY